MITVPGSIEVNYGHVPLISGYLIATFLVQVDRDLALLFLRCILLVCVPPSTRFGREDLNNNHGLLERKLFKPSGGLSLPGDCARGPRILQKGAESSRAFDPLRYRRRNRAAPSRRDRSNETRGRRTWAPRNISRLRAGARLRISKIDNRAARLPRSQDRHR